MEVQATTEQVILCGSVDSLSKVQPSGLARLIDIGTGTDAGRGVSRDARWYTGTSHGTLQRNAAWLGVAGLSLMSSQRELRGAEKCTHIAEIF